MSIFRSLLHLFFPERCKKCHQPGQALCVKCLRKIPFAAQLPSSTFAVFDYGNSIVRTSIRDLKYHRQSESARVLAIAASEHIAEYIADRLQSSTLEPLVLVPIPEHRRKQTTRGFNQSSVLASWWSKRFQGSSVKALLIKTVFTLPQAHLNRSGRLKNVAHTMECRFVLDPSSIYIIVDDVTTTGATFLEARRALMSAGAKKIFCIALAHGYAKK